MTPLATKAMIRRLQLSIALCITAAIATNAGAEQVAEAKAGETAAQAWDQAKVTELAAGLSTAVSGVKDAFRRELSDMMPSGDRRSRYQTKQSLRRLQTEAKQLSRELAQGGGHDETIDIFLQLQQVAHETAESARRTMLTQPTLDKIAEARESLTALAPYYGETWTPVMKIPSQNPS